MNYTLNIKGKLLSLAEPRVMGILNVTPDSFFDGSRAQTEHDVAEQANKIVAQGATFIDVGACSTRPGAMPVDQEEEVRRLRMALGVVRREFPQAVVSVDTFRPDVARMAVEEYGVDIINDVGAPADGLLPAPTVTDGVPDMLRIVARLQVPYVLMSGDPDIKSVLLFFAHRVQLLRNMGHRDIILDPGFGFGKTLEQNYALLGQLDQLLAMELPLLVGLSRKSMVCRPLDTDPTQALNGTTVLNTVALLKGASILRVHDVSEAVECVKLLGKLG